MLQQYSAAFDTVELNSSFYKAPGKGAILGLTRNTPRGFTFTAKINQRFTHDLRLEMNEKTQNELEEFVELFDPLLTQDKLGCLLAQLPPSLKRNDQLLEQFLAALPHRYDYVVEFRHPSWVDPATWRMLAKYEAAYCIVDEPLLPPEVHVTSPIGYVRWHGQGKRPWYNYQYTKEQLEDWVPKVREIQSSTKKTFGIFNNHFHGFAPENCIQTMKLLDIAEPKHEKTLRRLQSYIERDLAGLPPPGTLDQFTQP